MNTLVIPCISNALEKHSIDKREELSFRDRMSQSKSPQNYGSIRQTKDNMFSQA